jgi:hypothetical protein
MIPILSQINPVHTTPSYVSKITFSDLKKTHKLTRSTTESTGMTEEKPRKVMDMIAVALHQIRTRYFHNETGLVSMAQSVKSLVWTQEVYASTLGWDTRLS